jgi:hypothetical protein
MALALLAHHDTEMIRADLTRDDQVRYLATGSGLLGSSRDYLETIAHLRVDARCYDASAPSVSAEAVWKLAAVVCFHR